MSYVRALHDHGLVTLSEDQIAGSARLTGQGSALVDRIWTTRAVAAAQDVRDAVQPGQHDPGVLRSALQRVKTTLVGGSVDLIGNVILGGFAGLLTHYGIPVS